MKSMGIVGALVNQTLAVELENRENFELSHKWECTVSGNDLTESIPNSSNKCQTRRLNVAVEHSFFMYRSSLCTRWCD